jgi:hypothetical protein
VCWGRWGGEGECNGVRKFVMGEVTNVQIFNLYLTDNTAFFPQKDQSVSDCLTFRNLASFIEDGHTATLNTLYFLYLTHMQPLFIHFINYVL